MTFFPKPYYLGLICPLEELEAGGLNRPAGHSQGGHCIPTTIGLKRGCLLHTLNNWVNREGGHCMPKHWVKKCTAGLCNVYPTCGSGRTRQLSRQSATVLCRVVVKYCLVSKLHFDWQERTIFVFYLVSMSFYMDPDPANFNSIFLSFFKNPENSCLDVIQYRK